MRIILASQSPRRKKLLKQLGFGFEIQPSSVNESSNETNPIRLVEELALKKAKDIAQKNPNSFVIGSDTIVVHKGLILGKPETNAEASKMLNNLSDTQHQVHTGVALIQTDNNSQISKTVSFTDATTVFFHKLDQLEIDAYISTGSPMDKAGSYGIQDDLGAVFIKRIEGDFYNVVGLPINKVYYQLKKNFPKILEQRILKS